MSVSRSGLNNPSELYVQSLPLAEELNRIQYGQVTKYILIEQMPIGFGGQISGRLLALKLALALDRKAVFYSHTDPPYTQTFEPQHLNAPTNIDWFVVELFDPLSEQDAPFLRFNYLATMKRLDTVADHVEDWIHRKFVQQYDVDNEAIVDSEIFAWMRLLPEAQSMVDAEKKRLGICPTTLGVHLRRGDKSVESAYLPAVEVNRAIEEIHKIWPFESLFLASDSPNATKEISLPPGVALIFDATEKRYNNANHKMLFQNPELAQQETFTALKNLVLLSSCGGIIGQDNAHFPVIAARIIARRQPPPGRIVLLNGRFAEMRTPIVGRYYQIKRMVRAFIRKFLPQRWLRKVSRRPF